jgi:hypothetical protein
MAEKRYFTSGEANEALPAVRILAERMVAHRQALNEAQERYGAFAEKIAGNGGGLNPREFAAAQEQLELEAAGIARCVEGIHELGGIVKDLDEGLVDFLAKRGDEDVLLCWQVGEDRISHWHGLEEGFSGRKPL